jgi:hypothetical protein
MADAPKHAPKRIAGHNKRDDVMPRGSMPGERRGGRKCATPNRRTILADRIVAVLVGCSAASPEERLALLVNDQDLPADIRLAVAQKGLPGETRRVRPARQAKSELATTGRAPRPLPVETMSRTALDALFGFVSDAKVPDRERRKAAVKLAAYFLPKTPVNKRWRFTKDECGFAINAEIARDYRAIDFELQALKGHPNRDFSEFVQRIAKLQPRRDAIRLRLKDPCPTRYDAEEIWQDRIRLVTFATKRNAGIALTTEEDAEEAHRKARFDCYMEGPERTAQRRRQDLQEADDLFRKNRFFKDPTPPPLSRQERNDLWLLRWLYPPHDIKGRRDREAPAQADAILAFRHPFDDAEPAADGNLYPHDSKLRPASAGEADSIEGFVEYADDVPRYCIAISGQPPIFTNELPSDLLNDKSKPIQR